MITFSCPACGTFLRVNDEKAGRSGKCPRCGGRIIVPAAPSVPTASGARHDYPAQSPAACDNDYQQVLSGLTAGQVTSPPPEREGNIYRAAAGPSCPSCRHGLAEGAKVCTRCGIYVPSGRPLVTARGIDADAVHERARGTLSAVSWIVPFGLYPVHSEGGGSRRPFAIWSIFGATVLASIIFLWLSISDSPGMRKAKNLMLWCGRDKPTPELIEALYQGTSYGDIDALVDRMEQIEGTVPDEELIVAAHEQLTPEQQVIGRYRHSQLLSHALLHGGLEHLAGNMLFLIVLGVPVNAAIGNRWTALLYPLLAVLAALVFMLQAGGEPGAMLGASGAVMGVAGMYLVLFPAHRVQMAIWFRPGLLLGFRFLCKVFSVRGFWVVLLYIAFDVLYISLKAETGVAHWAHIGGFVFGIAFAVALLAARRVHTGSDMLSLVLGRHAWPIVGAPASHQPAVQAQMPAFIRRPG